MTVVRSALLVLMAALALALTTTGPARALSAEEEIVEEARLTMLSMLRDPDTEVMRPYLASARAVVIVPELYRGGFVIGAEGGEGVLLVRGENGGWSYPAFYFLGGGSIGLQIGGQVSEMVMTVMTDRGLNALLNRRVTLGADASVAVIAVGAGYEAGTGLDLDSDIYAFSRTQGLFAGMSLEGSYLGPQPNHNQRYYGAGATTTDILAGRRINLHADPLRATLPP